MTTNLTSRLDEVAPGLIKMLDERHELTLDLYKLAVKSHVKNGRPCDEGRWPVNDDEDIECHDCTLLLIASEELGQPEPFSSEQGA